jgi:hypothetical protein
MTGSPGQMVVACTRMVVMMRGVGVEQRQSLAGQTFRADLQPEGPLARRHEAGRNQRAQRECQQRKGC